MIPHTVHIKYVVFDKKTLFFLKTTNYVKNNENENIEVNI